MGHPFSLYKNNNFKVLVRLSKNSESKIIVIPNLIANLIKPINCVGHRFRLKAGMTVFGQPDSGVCFSIVFQIVNFTPIRGMCPLKEINYLNVFSK